MQAWHKKVYLLQNLHSTQCVSWERNEEAMRFVPATLEIQNHAETLQ